MDVGPELNVELMLSRSQHRDAPLGFKNALQILREVFEVKDYSNGGLTETETFALFDHFMLFITQLRREVEHYVETCQGSLAAYAMLVRRKPSYLEHCGFYLNRQRILYRQAGAVLVGVLTALGGLDPGLNFWRAITDGEGQALALKGQLQAARQAGQ